MKKVALIGLGNWGKILLNEFSKKAYVSNCITKGNLKNISWLRKNYPKIKYSKNYLEILNDKSIDIIVIATPISTHYQLILKALNSGKHVFVEKPLSNQYDQANYLKSIALKHNLCLFVGHTFIYHPVLNKIKTLIKTDPIIYFSMNWSKFGTFKENIFSNLLSHELSILLELIGNPKNISVVSSKGIISNLDIIIIKVNFSKNCTGIITIDRISKISKKTISITTKKQSLFWEDYDLYKLDKKNIQYKKIFHSNKTSVSNEISVFLNNIKQNDNNSHNLQLAINIVKLVSDLVD
jgi:predicted dehydrogenase